MANLFCRTKWSLEELNDKTVQFLLLDDDRKVVLGAGTFYVVENEDGLIEVIIRQVERGHELGTVIYTYHSLTQEAIDRIEKHPMPVIAEFILINVTDQHSSYLNTFVFPK